MRALVFLALFALGGPPAALADSDVYQPPQPSGPIAVYRGRDASLAPTVNVHRGSAILPGYLGAQALAAPGVETVGGGQIWLVDRAQGELTNCRAINTLNVGDRRIRCTRAALPD